jgi:hypothetical protein
MDRPWSGVTSAQRSDGGLARSTPEADALQILFAIDYKMISVFSLIFAIAWADKINGTASRPGTAASL